MKKKINVLCMALISVVILCGADGGCLTTRRPKSENLLQKDFHVEKIRDENTFDYNLFSEYQPFTPNNRLKIITPSPSLRIMNFYPKLDGATALFPVYGAIAQAVYAGFNDYTYRAARDYVQCSRTEWAYERLIKGEIDICFALEPSQEHIAKAAEKGVTFHRFPIGKEAFVFFVNKENPLNNLTVPQIQAVYQKQITNWNEVAGADEKILPFQRPQNSGSQTIMQKIMGDKTLAPPLVEENVFGMGRIIEMVAEYRNYPGAIGYSFRYYATEMSPNANIKFLAVDGIEPSVENIRSGAYPFTVNIYAVTTKPPTGNVKALIDWIVSSEGQSAVEQCGYVGL